MRAVLVGSVLALLLAAATIAAPKRWSTELERELMSPYCPGRALVECPSPQAAELRLWIAAQEDQGVPRKQVEDELFQRYGDILRQAPLPQGWGLWAYLVPAAAVLLGAALVFAFLRRQAAGAAAAPSAPVRPDPELERRLEEELGAAP